MLDKSKQISSTVLWQLIFLGVIIFIFILLGWHLSVFIPGALGAICLFVLLLRPFAWLTEVKKINRIGSIVLLFLMSIVFIIGPLFLLINTVSRKILVLVNNKEKLKEGVDQFIAILNHRYGVDLFNQANLGKIVGISGKAAESILNASVNSIMQIGIAYLLLFFIFLQYKELQAWIYRVVPFKRDNLQSLGDEMKKLVISNAVGVPLTAFLQACIAYVGYLIFGVSDAFMLYIMTIFAAMLPVVGASLIYLPVCAFLFISDQKGNALGLLIYCVLIVGSADNLIRFLLQKKMANVHPLVTIFGVIIGLNLFGFIGIIFGPILISLFIWLVKLYNLEFGKNPGALDPSLAPPPNTTETNQGSK
ncbi:AI-2E family transporter [Myroides sp. LJL115]